MSLRVLSFMAHPDDAEMGCAGTLARLKREAGCEIVIATATSGDCGTMEYPPDEIARIRHAEAVSAAKLLDAPYFSGHSSDLLIMFDERTVRRFTEVIRKARPDVVITHPPMDYLIDHEVTSRLVRAAAFSAPAPNFLTYDEDPAPRLGHIPHLYYVSPVECKDIFGQEVAPGFVVDVTATMATKEEMLACHASQRNWLRAQHGMDEYIESMKERSAAMGARIGVRYAEGYNQHLGHAYPQNNVIEEMLVRSRK
jgi:N-acetylglucosamine malate deacetylase 1